MKISEIISIIHHKLNPLPSFFDISVADQKEYSDQFKLSNNLITRGYYQYSCQKFLKKKKTVYIENFISLLILPFFVVLLLVKKGKKKITGLKSNIAVSVDTGANNTNYSTLNKNYEVVIKVKLGDCYYLRFKDLFFLFQIIIRNIFAFNFILKNIYKIAIYRSIIDRYKPKSIITAAEYSFTSSVLTLYCNKHNVEHIDIMHGEKLYNIGLAFFSFDTCYVWDEHYKKLFESLHAKCNNYIINKPDNLRTNNKESSSKPQYYMTYYLDIETNEELLAIRNSLQQVSEDTKQIVIRFHPRYNDLKSISSIFENFTIENPLEICIEKSLNNTQYAVSLYSTVLYQAFLLEKKVVLDDISFPKKYQVLKELDYIILSKPHQNLSNFCI